MKCDKDYQVKLHRVFLRLIQLNKQITKQYLYGIFRDSETTELEKFPVKHMQPVCEIMNHL